jgi:Cu/Zn superoxide dismutase
MCEILIFIMKSSQLIFDLDCVCLSSFFLFFQTSVPSSPPTRLSCHLQGTTIGGSGKVVGWVTAELQSSGAGVLVRWAVTGLSQTLTTVGHAMEIHQTGNIGDQQAASRTQACLLFHGLGYFGVI